MRQRQEKSKRLTKLLVAVAFASYAVFPMVGHAETIRLGVQNFLSYAPVFIALDKGYFKGAGLDVQPVTVRGGGTTSFNEVLAGDVDIASGAITASMLNAVSKGAKFKVIADKGQIRKGYVPNQLWINKKLADSGIKDITGLRGKQVATSGIGASDWVMLGMMADKYGMSIADKDILAAALPVPQRFQAVQAGTVAGAILVEPFLSQTDRSKAVPLMDITDVIPVFQTAVFYANQDFLTNNKAAVKKFLGALQKATALYMKDPTADDVVAIIAKHTKVSPAAVKGSIPVYFSLDGKVDADAIKKTAAFFLKSKLISKEVPLSAFIDKDAM